MMTLLCKKEINDIASLDDIKSKLSKNALNLLEKRYLKRGESGEVIENPQELFVRVAENIAMAEDSETDAIRWAREFYQIMTELDFLPNSPTLMNAGNDLQQLSACFVLPVEDSMEGIFNAVRDAALIHKSGGGTGFSFSNLRPEGDVVQSTGGISSGSISFMQVFNQATNTVKQGGKRRGANMGMLSVHHPDILDFIKCKGELNDTNEEIYESVIEADEDIDKDLLKRKLLDTQISNFNLSIAVTEEFMDALKRDDWYSIINPRTDEKEDELFAPEIFDLITEYAHKNGEPGLIFIDKVNQKHPINEKIDATNPCGEQPLLPFEACNLGSINLSNFVENGKVNCQRLEKIVEIATRFLDNVITMNNYPIDKIEEKVKANRKIGLGVMGFHEMLIKLGIRYDSEEGIEKARDVMRFINITAHNYSQELAKERGEFPNFDNSDYDKPIRNATLTTIAPTGSIGFIAGTSGGIEPFFSFEYSHTDADGNVSMFEYDFTEEADDDVLVTAMDIEPKWHIGIQSAFQEFIDNAVSKTINFSNKATIEDIKGAYQMAYDSACKGLTVYRDGSKTSQVLSTDSDEDKKKNNVELKETIHPNEMPTHIPGDTFRYETGCGKIYLTLNRDENGEPIETFINTGSEGGCVVMTESVSRLVSLGLRSGIEINEIIEQLKSTNTCPSFMYKKGNGEDLKGRSCPDLVGRILSEASKHYQDSQIATQNESNNLTLNNTDKDKKCPECGSDLKYAEGCHSCKVCGYSSCS
jgi:ribonucleoside-diphosphate reductase alpha chain